MKRFFFGFLYIEGMRILKKKRGRWLNYFQNQKERLLVL